MLFNVSANVFNGYYRPVACIICYLPTEFPWHVLKAFVFHAVFCFLYRELDEIAQYIKRFYVTS